MARTSNDQYDRVLTIRLVTDGDPQFWDWQTLLDLHPDETVEIIKVEDTEDYK